MMDEERDEVAVRVTPSARQANEWATVLAATGFRHRLAPTAEGWAVVVDEGDRVRAGAVLDAYDDENRHEVHPVAPAVRLEAMWLGVAVAALLLGFFAVTGPRMPGVSWFERGSASAGRILAGEGWRAVTAVTLHADLGHVLANAIACVVLIPPVVQALGPGTGLWVLIVSAAAANVLTAFAHGAPYASVGASTLTFGAIGVLTAQGVVARWRGGPSRRRLWVVLVASLLLLVMFGTAEGADVLGHLFGLLAGAGLGLALAVMRLRPFSAGTEWKLAAAAFGAVVACWWIA